MDRQIDPRALRETAVAIVAVADIEIDEEPVVDTSPAGGAWVQAWVWVPDTVAITPAQQKDAA